MKKAFTLIELMIVVALLAIIGSLGFYIFTNCCGDYTAEEIFLPEQTKARYQREMMEELRRSNDLKQQD